MGIVNLTSDSFYQQSRINNEKSLLEQVENMLNSGAGIIDIGGESSRPGAKSVSPQLEQVRVIPAVRTLIKKFPEIIISVDTCRYETAQMALDEGVAYINDITAGEASDDKVFGLCARYKAGLFLMHKKGKPETMQEEVFYKDVVSEVKTYLKNRTDAALLCGVEKKKLIVDPGIGFGKLKEHNIALLQGIAQLKDLGFPLLLGASMKRVLGDISGKPVEKRLSASLAFHTLAWMNGADYLRVHHVDEMNDTIKTFRACSEPQV